jgi:hypothetical protein
MELQPVKRVILSSSLCLGIPLITGCQIIEIKDHTILPRGMDSFVDAMKPLLLRSLEL